MNLLDPGLRLRQLQIIILSRVLDDRLLALYSAGLVPGNVFPSKGQEAYSAAAGVNLRSGDVFAPLIRDSAGRLAFGESVLDAVRTHLGKVTGPMRGRDGNVHRGNIAAGILPMISHLGAMLAVTVGAMMARRLRGELSGSDTCVGVASIGDGGMNTGACHEALNVAAVERLPFVLLVANNQLSYSTFNDRSFACDQLVDRAVGYGFRGISVDGTDPRACLEVVGDAIARARRGEGPQMVVASLLRLSGHGSHDDASYVPADMKSRFRDCIEVAQEQAIADGICSREDLERIWSESKAAVQVAVDQARSEADPDPLNDDWAARSVADLTTFLPVHGSGR
jgi:pyruvate dehydrogenase E1 component alpha subunit/2-oxoisovalerate dehydrogenase E1 component alpha subunit